MLKGCSRHRDNPARACSVCNRIDVESDIVTRVVDALLAAGYRLKVDDGESYRPEKATADRERILDELMEVDDEYLRAVHDGAPANGWVRFVYGNDGWDVISDYTINLESVLAPVNDYADKLGGNC
jgi:hypothetical protein